MLKSRPWLPLSCGALLVVLFNGNVSLFLFLFLLFSLSAALSRNCFSQWQHSVNVRTNRTSVYGTDVAWSPVCWQLTAPTASPLPAPLPAPLLCTALHSTAGEAACCCCNNLSCLALNGDFELSFCSGNKNTIRLPQFAIRCQAEAACCRCSAV